MYVEIMQPKLIELNACEIGSFYCLEEKSIGLPNGRAIVFLHGLGENRAGLNYLFHELSLGLRREGYAVYRFDLAGCGESKLGLSIHTWKTQVDALLYLLGSYDKIHFISRGVSSLLIPQNYSTSVNVAIGPLMSTLFLQQYTKIPIEHRNDLWVPLPEIPPIEREYFWYSLGVEAGCLGGFYLPNKFLEELNQFTGYSNKGCKTIISGKDWPVALPTDADYLPDCHPLFFFQKDRRILLNKLIRTLSH